MKQYETVIGLEVHVELATKTKIFCGCSTEFGGAPNTHTCPVCTGMPGSLPVLNKKVVEFALKAGLAANCQIHQYCKFDRKNYFYPDNPQNYQMNEQMDATILMVTHDAFSASYANRILFLRDGEIYKEIMKGSSSRKEFFEQILEVLNTLGGGVNDVR